MDGFGRIVRGLALFLSIISCYANLNLLRATSASIMTGGCIGGLTASVVSSDAQSSYQTTRKNTKKLVNGFLTLSTLIRAANANAYDVGFDVNDFYQKWPYREPSDFINFIDANTREGDLQSVIKAMDMFAAAYPMYKLTPIKAKVLSKEIAFFKPLHTLELGSFFGYSALHIASNMGKTGTLTCVEAGAMNVEVIRHILKRAFGSDNEILNRIDVRMGLSSQFIDSLIHQHTFGLKDDELNLPFDFVFLDHDKDAYLPDLRKLQQNRLLNQQRCGLVADNVLYPDELSDLLAYINYDQGSIKSHDPMITDGPSWQTRLERMPFEKVSFETKFKEVGDAMAVASYGM